MKVFLIEDEEIDDESKALTFIGTICQHAEEKAEKKPRLVN